MGWELLVSDSLKAARPVDYTPYSIGELVTASVAEDMRVEDAG